MNSNSIQVHCSAFVLLSMMSGCSAAWYAEDADREVHDILEQADVQALGDREDWVIHPKPRKDEGQEEGQETSANDSPEEVDSEPQFTPDNPLSVDLKTALEFATRGNREFISRREDLYLQGLNWSLTRFRFTPQLSSTVSLVWDEAEDSPSQTFASTDFSASQILPTGGTASVSMGLNTSRVGGPHGEDPDNGRGFGSSIALNLSQPLLRGAGHEVAYEALTQGERSLLYAIRSFELFRQDFAIQIARDFFELVRQGQAIDNARQRYEQAAFDRKKAEALRQVDRQRDEDVFLAQRNELEVQDALLNSETNYDRALDSFKIRLGLDIADFIVIQDQKPPFEPVDFDPDSAVDAARHNRLDLLTARERLEDDRRALNIAEKNLLPDVTLGGRYGLGGADGDFRDAGPDKWSTSLSLNVSVPLQRQSERNALRQSQIALERGQRDYTLQVEQIELDIRNQIRSLESLELQITIQKQKIEQDRRAVNVLQIRYESGSIDNRELLEARQGLVDAKNRLIDLQVRHFISKQTIRGDLGLLFIDEKGMFRE